MSYVLNIIIYWMENMSMIKQQTGKLNEWFINVICNELEHWMLNAQPILIGLSW